MKKFISIMMVALLSLGANVSAQEEEKAGATVESATTASGSTIGGIATSTVVIGAVAVGVAAAIISNNDDDGLTCIDDEVLVNGVCECPAGETRVNGVCTPDEVVLVCDDPRGGSLVGDLCVIPANTITDTNGVTITNTITYLPTEI